MTISAGSRPVRIRFAGRAAWSRGALLFLIGTGWVTPVSVPGADALRLVWDATPDAKVVGYNVYWGAASRRYTNVIRLGNVTEIALENLPPAPALYFAVTALDAAGMESEPSNEVVWRPSSTSASLSSMEPAFHVRGQGSIRPDPGSIRWTPGKVYTFTAVPASGYVFAGWSGSLSSSDRRLSFPLRPGLALEANFVPDPFPPLAGSYSGLLFETNAVRPGRAGFFTLTITARGSYSGWVQLAQARLSFGGQLSVDRQAVQTLRGKDGSALTLLLRFGNGAERDRVQGSLTSGTEWSAELRGDRAVFVPPSNTCPFAGRYTLAVEGKTTDAALPAGCGCGTFRVTAAGRVVFSGALGDGTRLSQSANLSKDGRWPFYAGLYGGRGLALGWLTFQPQGAQDLGGVIAWIKPPDARAVSYRAGFADVFEVRGSVFVAPTSASESALGFANARLVFAGPCLASSFTNSIVLGSKDRINDLNPNSLVLSFARNAGDFAGRVREPATDRWHGFRGVVLQKPGIGLGFVECDGATARVELGR